MIELELLGANGDTVVMTDGKGERYSIVVDDALRAAVRRARPAALSQAIAPPAPGSAVRPRELQAFMRAGASAEEVATLTGMDVDHVRRFEGPVLAERAWAVRQAQACRIGWEKDSPVLGELVVDRLATRGVEPTSLQWDALREGRDPWQVTLAFVQGAQAKLARWELDMTARSVSALDEEARWLTEAAAAAQRSPVFDQDSPVSGASAISSPSASSASSASSVPTAATPVAPAAESAASPAASPATAGAAEAEQPAWNEVRAGFDDPATDALLADLASSRGRRLEVEPPSDEEEPAEPMTSPRGQAQIVSMSDRRKVAVGQSGHYPAGTRRRASAPSAPSPAPPTPASPQAAASTHSAPTMPLSQVDKRAEQDGPAPAPAAPPSRPKRRSRRSVPSWDEIVFGAKPE